MEGNLRRECGAGTHTLLSRTAILKFHKQKLIPWPLTKLLREGFEEESHDGARLSEEAALGVSTTSNSEHAMKE